MFVDRGHARSAISLLAKFLNIRVNLKYCTIYIIRNFATKFSFKETDVNVRVAIFRLQKVHRQPNISFTVPRLKTNLVLKQ